MISSLQSKERANRSHPSRGAPVPSAQSSSACFIRVSKRDQLHIALISLRPQTLLRQRTCYEAALRRPVHFFINRKSLEA
jgi:hypothetical protein